MSLRVILYLLYQTHKSQHDTSIQPSILTLIDHGFSSKNQFQGVQIFSPSVEIDCFLLFCTCFNFLVEPKNRKQSFILINRRKFDANNFNHDLSNQDWSNFYLYEDENRMYNVFVNVFSTTLELNAQLKIGFQPKRKIEKTWLTKS